MKITQSRNQREGFYNGFHKEYIYNLEIAQLVRLKKILKKHCRSKERWAILGQIDFHPSIPK